MKKMKLMSELLNKRETLQAISQITFTFATLNKRFPVSELTDKEALDLISEYEGLITKVKNALEKYESENGDEHGEENR